MKKSLALLLKNITSIDLGHDQKIDALNKRFLDSKIDILVKKTEDGSEQVLKAKVPEYITAAISEIRRLDCECRKKAKDSLLEKLEISALKPFQIKKRLTAFIHSKYMNIVAKLTREFRIFTGINAVVFLLLGLAAFFRRAAGLHLIFPTLVLVLSAVITGYLYLFNQNWLYTIVFSDYLGLGYVLYLFVVFGFLSDIFFNRARVTACLLSSVSASVQISPC